MRRGKRQILSRQEALQRTISRRQLLAGAGAAAATACAAGPGNVFAATKAKATKAPSGRLIPDGKLGTITFTQRDVPGRVGIAASAALGVAPTMGFIGGPDFPEDPNDLGPLVPLPGGWLELLEFLREAGFKQIEFAGYGQNANNPGGVSRTRRPAASPPRRRARRTWPTGARCGASLTSSGSRRSATTASSRTPGRARTARVVACR